MKTLKNLIISLAVLIGISSCNTLDFDPTDRYNDATAFSTKENVAKYMAGLYPTMRIYSEFGDRSFGSSSFSTDGLTYMLKYSSNTAGYGTPNLVVFSETQITPSQNVVTYWSDCYTRIRKVNEFLDGLDSKCDVLNAEEKNHYRGEARFLRGYLYYLLVRAHKNVILYDYLGDWKNFHKANSSEAEGWEFVYQDLEYAYNNLADGRLTTGRVDKATAAALMSRAMLFAEIGRAHV